MFNLFRKAGVQKYQWLDHTIKLSVINSDVSGNWVYKQNPYPDIQSSKTPFWSLLSTQQPHNPEAA